jgi:hypothetical protein
MEPKWKTPMTDPFDPHVPESPNRSALDEMKKVDATLGWIAGGVIALLLLLVFVWGSFNNGLDTASLNKQSTPLTESVPTAKPAPPETTGQGAH